MRWKQLTYLGQLADAISRDRLSAMAAQHPSHIPAALVATTGLDIPNLESIVQQLFSAGIAGSTQLVYRSGTTRYLRFCSQYPFPVSERSLCYFLVCLFNDGVAGRTAKTYLSGIRHSQIALGLGDPRMSLMPQLEYVTKVRGQLLAAYRSPLSC